MPGCIVKALGPVTYLVIVYGKVYKRHVNQMINTDIDNCNVSNESDDDDDLRVVQNIPHVPFVAMPVNVPESTESVEQEGSTERAPSSFTEGIQRPQRQVKPPDRFNL